MRPNQPTNERPSEKTAGSGNLTVPAAAANSSQSITAPSPATDSRDLEGVWKDAQDSAKDPSIKSLKEIDTLLRGAMNEIGKVVEEMVARYAGAYAGGSGNNVPDAIHRRYTGDYAFVRIGYPQPRIWAKYEIRILNGQLVFRVNYPDGGTEFYRTSSSSPDYGPRFQAAVRESLAPQLKSEMDRND